MAIRHSKGLMNSAWSLCKKCKNFPVCFSITTVCPMLQLVFPKLGLVIIRHGPQCLRLQVVKAPKGSAKNCHFVSICPIIWKRTQILNYLSGKNPQDQSLILFSSLFQCKSIKLISPDYTINLHSLAKELRGVPSEQRPRWSPAELWSRIGQNSSLLLQKKSSLLCFHMQRVDAMCSSTSLIILSNWIYK